MKKAKGKIKRERRVEHSSKWLPACFPVPKRRHHPGINTSQTTGLLKCQATFDAPHLLILRVANGWPGNGGEVRAIDLEVRKGFL